MPTTMYEGDGDLDVLYLDNEGSDAVAFKGVEFISFVNEKTYGKPPIIAPGTESYQPHEADVLFINPANLGAMRVKKS